jgi:hypothetical protein
VTTKSALLGLVLLAMTPSLASAQDGDWADKNGAIGIGANVNLGGSAGLHFRTYFSDYFGIMGTFGLGYATAGNDNIFGLDAGIYAMLKVAPFDVGHISLLFGADFIYRRDNNGGGPMVPPSEDLGFLGALGLMGEWFPMQHFSFFASAGLRLGFVQNQGVGAFGLVVSGDGFALDLGAGLWGQAGFTVWFS